MDANSRLSTAATEMYANHTHAPRPLDAYTALSIAMTTTYVPLILATRS